MDFLSVLIGYVLNGIKKNKATKKITSDIMDPISDRTIALWEKIKPEFIKSNKDLAERIEANPDDQKNQLDLKHKLQEKLADAEFKSMITEELNKIQLLEKNKSSNILNIHELNSSGDNAINIQNTDIGQLNIENKKNSGNE